MRNMFIRVLTAVLVLGASSLSPAMTFQDAVSPVELALQAEYLLSANQPESARYVAEEALRKTTSTVGLADVKVADLYHLIARIDLVSRDYDSATKFARMALAMREDILGPEHKALAECLSLLAEIYERLNLDEKAQTLHRTELEIRARACGVPADPSVVAQARF